MLQIGPYTLDSRVVLAPMAGVTDLPFRRLCKRFGAGLVVSEMITSDKRLWHTRKSQQRMNHELAGEHEAELEPRSVQIAGSEPAMMAEAAQLNVDQGAQIIDINMGCPAKKVCKKAAGSALMKDELLVREILQSVVSAVDVPVTLKIRTGWSPDQRNGVTIARIAEDCGIQALAVHGRTRACAFKGEVEYDTIAAIKEAVEIPIIANGDIDSPQKALEVMEYTNADGIMVGRAAQGRPWICNEIDQYLSNRVIVTSPAKGEIGQILLEHLNALHTFYGDFMGVKIARKHVGWYLKQEHLLESKNQNIQNNSSYQDKEFKQYDSESFRKMFNSIEQASEQRQAIEHFFEVSLSNNHQKTFHQEVFAA